MKSYRDLDVWQHGMDLVIACYEIARQLPREERFALSAQLRRAAVSIPSNVAEGHDREGTNEYAHHVSIAQGSAAEVDTLLETIRRLGYATAELLVPATTERARVSRMLTRLHQSLRRKLPSPVPRRRPPVN